MERPPTDQDERAQQLQHQRVHDLHVARAWIEARRRADQAERAVRPRPPPVVWAPAGVRQVGGLARRGAPIRIRIGPPVLANLDGVHGQAPVRDHLQAGIQLLRQLRDVNAERDDRIFGGHGVPVHNRTPLRLSDLAANQLRAQDWPVPAEPRLRIFVFDNDHGTRATP